MESIPLRQPWSIPRRRLAFSVVPIRALQLAVSSPTLLFLAALTAMLFRPPDLKSFPIDRVASAALLAVAGLRFLMKRQHFQPCAATWPLFLLLLLGLWNAVAQPYDPQAWSLFVAKYLVPFVCFHLAGAAFQDESALAKWELYLLAVLLYLSAVSILSLLNAPEFIFPRYIVDESIGMHFDRARGPFLQAVANGVCLNLLGLCALDSYSRGRLRTVIGVVFFFAVPLALLATKTRAVWASSAVSIIYLVFRAPTRRQRRISLALCIAVLLCSLGVFCYRYGDGSSFTERMADRSPVDFRSEMYRAGWEMFREKPLFGWGNEWQVQPEIEKRVSAFHPEYYVFHNTFLELMVQHGLLGLGCYGWLWFCLFKLGGNHYDRERAETAFLNAGFRRLWPVLIIVYLVNASAVVMNYQFVNAVLFTIGGILATGRARLNSPLREARIPQ